MSALTGTDGDKTYSSPQDLWVQQQDSDGSHSTWYKKAVAYWDNQEASYNGVLGGFAYVSDIDVADSRNLLQKVMKTQLEQAAAGQRTLVAMDCGAGVGRVTKELLIDHFQEVDLLEPSRHLLECAEKNLTSAKVMSKFPPRHKAVNFYCAGLQEHNFLPLRYDCIWVQWCLLYLTDEDVIHLMARCKSALKPDGVIIVKENICKQGFVVDNDDSSLTRSNAYMVDLFERANTTLLLNVKQKNFPKELFEVRMYAVRPK